MGWPQGPDYAEAMQNLNVSFRDPLIQTARVEVNRLGQPKAWSGNFAAVFQVHSASGRNWAIKCFTREVPALQERYREIDAHLRTESLPFAVRFDYVPAGLLVQGRWHPFLRMDWVEGESLDAFVEDSLRKGTHGTNLRLLADMWLRLAERLRKGHVGHGDLQHGNVILVPVPEKKSYALKVIDYDGMFVPALAQNPPQEVGHGAYQHPDRVYGSGYGPDIDEFSHLVIYTTLQCLITEGESLWQKYHTGDNLLFRRQDFDEPERSPLFHQLWKLPDRPARTLVGHVLLAAKGRLEDVPRVDELILDSGVTPLTAPQERRVEEILSRGAAQVRRAPQFAPPSPTPVHARPRTPQWWTQPIPAPQATPTARSMAPPLRTPHPGARKRRLTAWASDVRARWARLSLLRKAALVVACCIPLTPLIVATLTGTLQPASSVTPVTPGRLCTFIDSGHHRWGPRLTTFSPDGRKLFTKSVGKAQLWDAATGQNLCMLEPFPVDLAAGNSSSEVAFSPDGRWLSTTMGFRLILWDATTGHQLRTFQPPSVLSRGATSAAFSPDGGQLIVGFNSGTAVLWDTTTGKHVRTFTPPGGVEVHDVAFSPDGAKVLAADSSTVILWNAATGQEVRTLSKASYPVAFSPDGRKLLTQYRGGAVLWDATTGEELRRFDASRVRGNEALVGALSLAFVPDGPRVLVGYSYNTAILWDAATGRELMTFDADSGGSINALSSVALSPDGRHVLTGSRNGTAILWDAATGRELRRFQGPNGAGVARVAFSPDGPRAVTESPIDGTTVLWDIEA